jgi:hypothetical protein
MSTFEYATKEGVSITLGGEPVLLRYTLGASRAVSTRFREFPMAFTALYRFDIDAFVGVIAAGLGDDKTKAVSNFEDAVFAAGMDSLIKPLIEYLAWLSNGGRAPTPLLVATGSDSGNA